MCLRWKSSPCTLNSLHCKLISVFICLDNGVLSRLEWTWHCLGLSWVWSTQKKKRKKNFSEFKVLVWRTVQPKWLFPSEIVREAKTIQYVRKRRRRRNMWRNIFWLSSIPLIILWPLRFICPSQRAGPNHWFRDTIFNLLWKKANNCCCNEHSESVNSTIKWMQLKCTHSNSVSVLRY